MTTLELNGRSVSVHSPEDTPLLWVIRDEIGLAGTKFGCGIGFCGACTVHVEGRATRSCITPLGAVAGEIEIGAIFPFREIRLDVARVIAPDRAEHRRPRLGEREKTAANVDPRCR